jgi:tetratricopeptide (TPR) repeat protein
MGWTVTLLRAVLIVALLYLFLEVIRWPPQIHRAEAALWRPLEHRARLRFSRRRLAAQAEMQGDAAAAVELRRDIVASGLQARSPDVPNDVLHLARLLLRRGRFAEAAEWFAELDRRTAENHHLKPTMLLSMAYNLSYLGRYEQADWALHRASTLTVGWDQWLQRRRLRSATTRWDLAMAHGFVASVSGRFLDAQHWYESALSLSRTLGRVKRLATLSNLAATALGIGDLENAERRVEEVNQLAGSEFWPGQDNFRYVTGDLRLAQGRLKEARDLLSGVLVPRSRNLGALVSLAEIAYHEGRFDEANAYVAQIQTDPVDASTRRKLAASLDSLAEFDEAGGRQVEAEERRRRANTLREKPPVPTPCPDDGLLQLFQSTFAGECFGPPGPTQSLASGLYLVASLSVAVSILLPLDLAFPILAIQVAALILLILGFSWLNDWVFAPTPSKKSRP